MAATWVHSGPPWPSPCGRAARVRIGFAADSGLPVTRSRRLARKLAAGGTERPLSRRAGADGPRAPAAAPPVPD